MNVEDINDTIIQLENGDTTFDSCLKLASLYIVKEHISNTNLNEFDGIPDVIKEYKDILPEYERYKQLKTRYQLGELDANCVINCMNGVCKEIKEFINTLYANTDTPEERQLLITTFNDILNTYK